jgi:hypothetical protein
MSRFCKLSPNFMIRRSEDMKHNIVILLVAAFTLSVGVAHDAEAQKPPPWNVDSVDTFYSETLCASNHFDGCVRDCDGNPDPGVTVTLTCPDGSQETGVTNSDGEYCFARPFHPSGQPSWEPGYYGLTAGCLGKLVYREGDGDIEVDLSSCCPGE